MRMWQVVVTLPCKNSNSGKTGINVFEAFTKVKKIFSAVRASWVGSGTSFNAIDTQYQFRDERVARGVASMVKSALKNMKYKHKIDIYSIED